MQKINAFLNKGESQSDNQFNKLVAQANAHLDLQQFWLAVAPYIISQSSSVISLKNGQLTIAAHSSAVATKIKLTSTSLLTQLQNLQKDDSVYKYCKVTGIKVKVQVKSQQKRVAQVPRALSSSAAITLRNLADELGDSALADKLNRLADNA